VALDVSQRLDERVTLSVAVVVAGIHVGRCGL
jgi:hypothetical protein